MRFTDSNTRWQQFLLWLMRRRARFIAHGLARQAIVLAHNDDAAFCWPCEARARVQRDSHQRTIGPFANIYCLKCGLEQRDWRKWCSNRVEKEQQTRAGATAHISGVVG